MTLVLSKDWRLPENRLEAFARVTHTRFVEGDLDHHHSGKVITDMMGMDNEQKALYAMIFGQSYRNHWSMISMQLFPDLLKMDDEKLQKWHDENWRRIKYSNDTKWNLRKFPAFIKNIKSKIGNGSLYQYLGDLATVGNTKQNYESLNKGLLEFYSIGRMTAWLAQQTLYEFFDWDIDHWDQQLYKKEATWSQYDAMCYLFGREDLCRAQKRYDEHGKMYVYRDYVPNDSDIRLMEDNTIRLMEYLNERIPFHVDIYNIESVECEFRKTAYGPKIKEFTFWTTNELADQYKLLRSHWADYDGGGTIDWKPYVTGIMTKGRNVTDFSVHPDYFKVMTEHGLNMNTHHLYKDEPNAFKELDLFKNKTDSMEMLTDDWNEMYSTGAQHALRTRFNPVKYLRGWKPADHPSWKDPNINWDYLRGVRVHPLA